MSIWNTKTQTPADRVTVMDAVCRYYTAADLRSPMSVAQAFADGYDAGDYSGEYEMSAEWLRGKKAGQSFSFTLICENGKVTRIRA